MSEDDTLERPVVTPWVHTNPPISRKKIVIFQYNRYKTIEERIYIAIFWIGVLLLILWVEICIGLAVWRVLGKNT